MGYEQIDRNFSKFYKEDYLKNYIERGYHHIRLSLDEDKQIKHLDLIRELLERYETSEEIISKLLNFKKEDIEGILNYLVQFKTNIPLILESPLLPLPCYYPKNHYILIWDTLPVSVIWKNFI